MKINDLVVILRSTLVNVKNSLIESNRFLGKEMSKYYAVANGRHNGVYNSWDECKQQVSGYSGAKYKSFKTAEEAQQFVNGSNHSNYSSDNSHKTSCSSEKTPNYSWNSGIGGKSCDDFSSAPIVYTDGACSKNGFNGANGGIGVYWGDGHEDNVSEPLHGRQTNNRAEIMAAKRAIEQAKQRGYDKVRVLTDSNFLKQSVDQWMPKWKRNGWKKSDGTPVLNKDDFVELDAAMRGISEKVAAHRGIHGNEEADRLANEGICKRSTSKRLKS